MREGTFRPGGAGRCDLGIKGASLGAPLTIVPDDAALGGYILMDSRGHPVGFLTAAHWVSKELALGQVVLHATINSVGASERSTVTVRVVTGNPGQAFALPERPKRTYRVGIVGESYRQQEISKCRAGDAVRLVHTADNEHDPRAIAVIAQGDRLIGYLPRGGWLTVALIDEAKAYIAEIAEIVPPAGLRPNSAVILAVSI